MLAAVATVHVAALFGGFALGRIVGLDRENWITVGIAGSQKTLMIGIQIAIAENWGLGILPMVAYHASQLLIDTVVADRLSAKKDAAGAGDSPAAA
jgi:sodium/bile acid cotransporter 7